MLSPHLSLYLLKTESFTALHLMKPASNCRQRFGAVQSLQQCPVACRILNDQFGATINGHRDR